MRLLHVIEGELVTVSNDLIVAKAASVKVFAVEHGHLDERFDVVSVHECL